MAAESDHLDADPDQPLNPHPAAATSDGFGEPLLVEDVMLMLFDERSGTFHGEGTLFYVLAGATITDLALDGRVEFSEGGMLSDLKVSATGDSPADPLLTSTWEYVADKPRGAQTVLAAIGPNLRAPVLERLVARGYIVEEDRKILGFSTKRLRPGDSTRRTDLIRRTRAVLVDGAEPDQRLAATIGVVSASGSLPALHHEIPWSGKVATRAKQLEDSVGGADAAGQAVLRTTLAIVTSTLSAITASSNR